MQQLTIEQALEAIGPGWPESCPTCGITEPHTTLGDKGMLHQWAGGRRLVHTMTGGTGLFLGADWARDEVEILLRLNEDRLFYNDSPLAFGHPLYVQRRDLPPLSIQVSEGWSPHGAD